MKNNSFKINDEELIFELDKCNLTIEKELLLKIQVRTANLDHWRDQNLILKGFGEKLILSFAAHEIHQKGIPTGNFNLEKGSTGTPYYSHLRIDGIDPRFNFFGTVIYKESWVSIKGVLKHTHNKELVFNIEVNYELTLSNLDWSKYQYESLEETDSVNPLDVRHLNIRDVTFSTLPSKVLLFTNLETLNIGDFRNIYSTNRQALTRLPENIDSLNKLTELRVTGTKIEALPESIGMLKDLTGLYITRCQLKDTPKSLWQLPNLNGLSFAGNQLTHIPSDVHLPKLTSINLSDNLLTTLDKAITELPKLMFLNLKGNPWETLAPEAIDIEHLDLSMDDKLRLLDFSYRGADGKGQVLWDNTAFFAEPDSAFMARVDKVIEENDLSEFSGALRSSVKKAVGFTQTEDEDYSVIGNHRFGGMPDLPSDIAYPTFAASAHEKKMTGKDEHIYEFIAQINCEAIADLQRYLPRTGTLFFFLQTLHHVDGRVNQTGVAKVIYHPNNSDLSSGARFDFDVKAYYEMYSKAYRAFKSHAKPFFTVPSCYAIHMNTHFFVGEAAVLKNQSRKFYSGLYERFEKHLTPDLPLDHGVNAHEFTQNDSPELQAAQAFKGQPEDWITLLAVGSVGDFQWMDAGRLFYVIHKSDLAKLDFSNIFITLESS